VTNERDTHPLVSVIMPTFNSARTLRDSAQSVLDQSERSCELIIIDDGSTDDTAEVARGLADGDSRVRFLSRTKRGGPAAARNTGIAAARGRYLAFCDADDLWLHSKLEQQLAQAQRSGAALVFSSYFRIDAAYTGPAAAFTPNGRVVHAPARLTYRELLDGNSIGCLTALVDLEQTGPVMMPDIPGAEDWALWLHVIRKTRLAVGLDEPLALYRTAQPGSHSASRWRALKAVWRVLRQEGLSTPRALGHLAVNAAGALRKSRI